MRQPRGFTLIELMIAVAILGIAGITWISGFQQYQRASDRTYRIEGLARVLDVELERFRACPDVECLRSLTRGPVAAESDSWVRAKVTRSLSPGPDGSFLVTLTASLDEVPVQALSGLVWVPR